MNSLWAPWRMEYIKRDKSKKESCIFCDKYSAKNDRENLVLYRNKTAFVLMNLYPYNNGHLLIAPVRHIDNYETLTDEETAAITALTQLSLRVLKKVARPEGFNIGMNLGIVGGAGIANHIHQHIVPRWTGDTNFMPVVGHTKVMIEGLLESWEDLVKEFIKLGAE